MDRTRAPIVAISLTVVSMFGAIACSRSAPYAAPPAREPPVQEQPVQEQPVQEETTVSPARSFIGQRLTVGLNPATSIECYTFYADGTVELRHNGLAQLTDRGVYSGGKTSGQIDWQSGGRSAVAVSNGNLVINGLKLTPIPTCVP